MGKGKSMGETFRFDYYYGVEAEQFSFYRVPRILIKDKKFKNLSSDAKLLYGLMLDRISLSMKNGWLDAENKVYIYYTMENIMDDLSCAKATAVKVLAELDSKKGIGLVEKKRQGLGRPDIIYVKNFATVELTEPPNLDFKEWEDYSEEKNCKETYVDDYECFAEFGLQEENTFEFSKSEESVVIADCECPFSYETKQTKVQKDDALSESEIAFLRQLGIENPQDIAHETISIHGEEKETDFTYPRYDIPYGNSEIEYSNTQNLAMHEYMQENTDDFSMESSEIQDFGFERLDICRSSEIELQEVQNLDFRKFERQNCRSSEVELQEVKELNPNYTNNNYTNKSYTEMNYNNLIYPIYQSDKKTDRCDGLDESSAYISLIKKNLEYYLFMQDRTWKDRELYDELFQIVCDVVCVKRKSVRVSGENYPYEIVKSKFLKLNSSHLTYVIDCMRKTVSKIGNIKSYMITALYNAGNTITHYYQQAVQHDMYGGGWKEVGIV